jgi:hypothetical protein
MLIGAGCFIFLIIGVAIGYVLGVVHFNNWLTQFCEDKE